MPRLLQPAAPLHALAEASGLDLPAYRAEHVEECLRRAVEREGAGDADELARRVRHAPRARLRFRRSLAVSVTGMFRDPAQFDAVEALLHTLPAARGAAPSVWSAGCSNGAELFSAALLLERHGRLAGTRLLGSDVLEENIATARSGGPDPASLSAAVRAAVRWEVRDLVAAGPPPGRWSLVLCRNVGIYFADRAKAALHATLAAALVPGGLLMLGRSESLAHPARLGLDPAGPHLYRRAA
jgi:chemotaxis protein methyltransferase CheR